MGYVRGRLAWDAVPTHRRKSRCSECGKAFERTQEHAYRLHGAFMCSYTCWRAACKREYEQQEREAMERGTDEEKPTREEECLARILELTRRMAHSGSEKERVQHRDNRKRWLIKLEDALRRTEDDHTGD